MKIAIIGTRGIPSNYGGFETFAEEVAVRLAERNVSTLVVGDASNPFVGNSYKGVQICNSKFSKPRNPLAFYYDSIKIAVEENSSFVLMCGVGGSLLIPFFLTKKITLAINPDGLGFKRDKYVWWKKILFFCQYFLSSYIPKYLVFDSIGVKNYYKKVFRRTKNVTVIEYGTYLNSFSENLSQLKNELIKYNYNYIPFKYHLVVSRLEPENNVEAIIKGYLLSKKKYPLVIVGNLNTKHSKVLIDYANENIHFVGGIYNKDKLMVLRAASLTYLHGHSVGGTNPSLLEAMGSRNCCICHDNEFNREVIGNNGLFFSSPDEVSDHILAMEDNMQAELREQFKQGVYEKASNYYCWERITEEYLTLAKSFV